MTGNLEGMSNLMQLLELLWKRLKKEEMKHEWWNSCSEIAEDEVRISCISTKDDRLFHLLLK